MVKSVFHFNREILNAKGWIPYWEIAQVLAIHENTLRNWMKSEMDSERKQLVMDAISQINEQRQQAIN